MNYQKLPFNTEKELYERIALLEWFVKHEEADTADMAELWYLSQLSRTYAEKRRAITLNKGLALVR